MPGTGVGRTAADLPWLCPDAESLIALAERPAETAALPADTALLVFLLRFARPDAGDGPFAAWSTERIVSPSLPETAVAYLTRSRRGWADRTHPFIHALDEFSTVAARLAASLAAATGRAGRA